MAWTLTQEKAARIAADVALGKRIDLLAAKLASLEVQVGNLTVVMGPPGGVSSAAIYGPGHSMDGLGNRQIGGAASGAANSWVSEKFVAETTGDLTQLIWYCLDETFPGYGGGTGGTIRIGVQSDASGYPNDTWLGYEDVAGAGTEHAGRVTTFSPGIALVAGTTYHIVFENVDASPTVNFVSANFSYLGHIATPRQVHHTDAQMGSSVKYTGGGWGSANDGYYTPIYGLTIGGSTQGQGYMQINVTPFAVTGANSMVRELFTVSGGDKVVTGAAIRLYKLAGGTDPLTVRLEDNAGTLIDSFTVAAASIVNGTSASEGEDARWVSGTFASPRTLTNGQTYRLRISTGSATTLHVYVMQQGSSYGYPATSYFGDGNSQKTTDGTTWASFNNTLNDLMFYFTL